MQSVTTITAYHRCIQKIILDYWQNLGTPLAAVDLYVFSEQPIPTPAVLISLNDMVVPLDEVAARTTLDLNMRIECVLKADTEDVDLALRHFSAQMMRLLQVQGRLHWGLGDALGELVTIVASESDQRPDYKSYLVHYTQRLYISDNVKPDVDFLPCKVFAGTAPAVGSQHQQDYDTLVDDCPGDEKTKGTPS